VTVIGAVIAAVTGIWNLVLQMRGKRDDFVVGLYAVRPVLEEETVMHVVSHSDHPITLTDWGFIEPDGRLTSINMSWETGDLMSEEIVVRGSADLAARGATLESGYTRRKRPVGAFAISVTQSRPRVCFDSDTPYWRRLSVRWRLLRKGPRYLT
jgi:hypothetical protein